MTGSRASWGRLLCGAGLAAQGLLLLAAARVGQPPAFYLPWLLLLLAAATMGVSLVAGPRPRRRTWFLLLATQAALVVLAAGSWRLATRSAAEWERGHHDRMLAEVRRRAAAISRVADDLLALADTTALLPARDADSLLAVASERWSALAHAWPERDPGFVVWVEGERRAWNAAALPLSLPRPDAPLPERSWQRVEDTWCWRLFAPGGDPGTPGPVLEIQFILPTAGPDAGRGWRDGSPVTISWSLVGGGTMVHEAWHSLGRGRPRLLHDLDLTGLDEGGRRVWPRLTAEAASWRSRRDAEAGLAFVLSLLAWGAAVVLAAWRHGGGWGLVLGLWAVRLLWLGADLFRWLQAMFPDQLQPAYPGSLASLIDPAYFATTFAAGLFASSAEALLTSVTVAGTVWLLVRRRSRAPAATGGADRLLRAAATGRALAFGLVSGALLLALRTVVVEIAENANARLIGDRVTLGFLSFWILHLVLLLLGGGVLGLVTGLAGRWRHPGERRGMWLVCGLATTGLAVATGLPSTVGIVLVGGVVLVWVAAPLARARQALFRRLALVVSLLMAVAWNYLVLAESYGRAERFWLQRKAEQLVRPQDDWIRFLMEDVLTEMRAVESSLAPPEGRTPLAQGLWRHRRAYELWERSAVHDLGMPCLVELLDADGYDDGMFASGFLREFGYEVRARSDWSEVPLVAAEDTVIALVQDEIRRYPTGEETIMRGEVPRRGGEGWIRLELPVQSRRIATLLATLEGLWSRRVNRGYRPRSEVDRPLLLLRGGASGWLDAGSGDFPAESWDAVVADLRAGRRDWADVEVDGDRYRCLWRSFPASGAASPGEGFLLGLEVRGPVDLLLDLSRLALLDLLMVGLLLLVVHAGRLLAGRRLTLALGFQERFLAGYLLLGLLLLLMAGLSLDRLSLARIDAEARQQTRDGLVAALGQLQGLLAEQAGALAESEYIADLLANRLAGLRPLGPFGARQGMVFSGSGQLLLDETLSDLSDEEAAGLLARVRAAPLVLVADGGELFFGTVIPIDLSGVLTAEAGPGDGSGDDGTLPLETDGFFFYRQRADDDLIAGLGEIVQGEVALRLEGEVVLASHPGSYFAGLSPLLAPPALVRRLESHPVNPYLYPDPRERLSYTGCVALPAIVLGAGDPRLYGLETPAILSVDFPARERDFAQQRERTVLFLAGLVTLILLVAALLAALLTWSIFGPVRILVTATRRLAAGDFTAPLPAGGGQEIGTLAESFRAMRDGLRAARDRLAARERFLTTVLDRVPVGVAVLDRDDRVVALNPACEAVLDGFYGAAPLDRDGRARRLLAGFRRLAEATGQVEGELRGEDGRMTLRGRLAPLRLPDGRTDTMLVFEDVTEFLANQRLALNAELARQVAHEIKNPLTPIQLSIQMLAQAYRDGAPDLDRIVEDTVRRILEQVSLLRSIAGEFSLLGRPGELECAPLDLPELVRRVTGGYADAEGGVGATVVVEPAAVPPVLGHRESLTKVLGNLMENSIDASGGAARLRLEIAWRIEPARVVLLWRDNGTGIAGDVAERLFDPYFSTKSKGTGLGLAICRNLLDKMGGSIALANREDGPGAVAEVTLLRADAAGPPQPEKDDATGPASAP